MEKQNKKIKSPITGCEYYNYDVYRITNPVQAAAYVSAGAKLLDLYVVYDRGSDQPRFLYVFDKEESKPYFDLWCKHQLY